MKLRALFFSGGLKVGTYFAYFRAVANQRRVTCGYAEAGSGCLISGKTQEGEIRVFHRRAVTSKVIHNLWITFFREEDVV